MLVHQVTDLLDVTFGMQRYEVEPVCFGHFTQSRVLMDAVINNDLSG